jgi:hypothetical protein
MNREMPLLPRQVRRDIIVLICIKLAALWLLYQLFFNSHGVPDLQPAQLATHLIGSSRTP